MNENDRKVMFSSQTDSWETPQWLFDRLDADYHFTLDPCATFENKKCFKFYTEKEDGLKQDWFGEHVFINPPFSQIGKWVEKAVREYMNKVLVVMLLPVRSDTKWFHSYIPGVASQIYFIKGRLKFGKSKNSAPFPSMIVVWNPEFNIERYSTMLCTLDLKSIIS